MPRLKQDGFEIQPKAMPLPPGSRQVLEFTDEAEVLIVREMPSGRGSHE